MRELKIGLCHLGHLSAASVNDVFDFNTLEAVREFQSEAGLKESGVFDEDTRRALVSKLYRLG